MTSLRNRLRAMTRTTAPALLAAGLALAAAPDLQAQARPDSTRAAGAQGSRPPSAAAKEDPFAAAAPVMAQMTQMMLQSSLRALATPESAQQLATFTRNYFDALLAKGFTREEALRIVMAHGIPSASAGKL